MRTTVTLDTDVERLLKTTAHQRGKSVKVVLNDAVRQSLGGKKHLRKPTLNPPTSMGLRAGLDPQRLNQLADDLEAGAFLSATRRLKKARGASGHDHP
jgi:hypothetical protein